MTLDEIRDPRAFRWVESGVSGLAPAREWDVVTSTRCDVEAAHSQFVAIHHTHLVVEAGSGEAASCGFRVLNGQIEPPYRAVMTRREGDVWAVGAVKIAVAELQGLDGDELTMIQHPDGSRELLVDGRPQLLGAERVASLAGSRSGAYVVRARRLDNRFWEFTVDPL